MCPSFGLPVAGSPGTPFFPFFPFFSSFFFFFLFWPSKMEKSRAAAASGRGGAESNCGVVLLLLVPLISFFFFSILAVENGGIRSCCVVGERRSCCVVGVGLSGKKKTTQPKTTLFWVGVIFFKNQNTPKRRRFEVTVFLKSEHPKRRRFEVFYLFIFFKNDKPKTASFWASSNQNDAVLGCLPYKSPSFSDFIPKP